jgi:hypothetical protein
VAPAIVSANQALGAQGQPLQYQIRTQDAGVDSFSASGLPRGLALDPATGLISGTPSDYGSFTSEIGATKSGVFGSIRLSINIVPVITSPSAGGVTQGQAFQYTITASHNPDHFTADNLPQGLVLNGTTGVISGVPVHAGSYVVPITATRDAITASGNVVILVTVGTTSATTASGVQGQPFRYSITSAESVASYGASNLPPGLEIDTATGEITGVPTTFGVTVATLRINAVTGNSGSVPLTITISPAITSPSVAQAIRGQAFSYQIACTHTPTSYSSDPLPAGLSLNAQTGLISGTATTSGKFPVAISGSGAGFTASGFLTLFISPQISSANSAQAILGQPFSYPITAPDSVTSFAASGLPPGLSLNAATGLISGTPSTLGVYNSAISVSNPGGTGSSTVAITVCPLLTVTVSGSGSVTPGFLGATTRQTGQSYTLVATASRGSYFAGWTVTGGAAGDTHSLSSSLTITTDRNLVVRASFVPYLSAAAKYSGLISSSSLATSGYFSLTLSKTGAFTSAITFGGKRYSLSGQLTGEHQFTGRIIRSGNLPIDVFLWLDPEGSGKITGTFSINGSVVAQLLTQKPLATGAIPQQGKYTVLMPAEFALSGTDVPPEGIGYGTLTISSRGQIRFAGALGDSTPFSVGDTLAADGTWPLFIAPYKPAGIVTGTLLFNNPPSAGVPDITGTLGWMKPPSSTGQFYRNSFTGQINLVGSRYTPPEPGMAAVNIRNGLVTFAGGGLNPLPTPATASVGLDNRVTISSTPGLSMKLTISTGVFSGSFTDPVTKKSLSYQGVLIQKSNIGQGLFKRVVSKTGLTGSVDFR